MRDAKAANKDKETVGALVEALLQLKADYKALTGEDVPGASGGGGKKKDKKKKGKAEAKAEPAPAATVAAAADTSASSSASAAAAPKGKGKGKGKVSRTTVHPRLQEGQGGRRWGEKKREAGTGARKSK